MEIWLWTLWTCALTLCACVLMPGRAADAVETWLWTLFACDWTLLIALLTLLTSLLLLSLPQPDTATPAPTPNTAIPNTDAATADAPSRGGEPAGLLLHGLSPSPESVDADPLPHGLY